MQFTVDPSLYIYDGPITYTHDVRIIKLTHYCMPACLIYNLPKNLQRHPVTADAAAGSDWNILSSGTTDTLKESSSFSPDCACIFYH